MPHAEVSDLQTQVPQDTERKCNVSAVPAFLNCHHSSQWRRSQRKHPSVLFHQWWASSLFWHLAAGRLHQFTHGTSTWQEVRREKGIEKENFKIKHHWQTFYLAVLSLFRPTPASKITDGIGGIFFLRKGSPHKISLVTTALENLQRIWKQCWGETIWQWLSSY